MDGDAVEVGAAMNAVGCCACQLGAGCFSGHGLACYELMDCFYEGGAELLTGWVVGHRPPWRNSQRWGFWLVQTAGGVGCCSYSGFLLQAPRESCWRKMLSPSTEGSGREVIPTQWSWENPNREMYERKKDGLSQSHPLCSYLHFPHPHAQDWNSHSPRGPATLPAMGEVLPLKPESFFPLG